MDDNNNNQIMIDEISFYICNFNGTGIDYKIHVYAQDVDESDMYEIKIFKVNKFTIYDLVSVLHADSCGGCLEHEFPYAKLTNIEEYVLDILFKENNEGIIRGF